MTAQPDYAVPTGEFIAEWMGDNGLTAAELSRRLGVSRKHVSELLSGKATLSHALALDLERVTDVPARIWNQYEAGYREDQARLEADEALVAQYDEAETFPLAYLRKHGLITAGARDKAGTVGQLLGLFDVASIAAWHATWECGSVAYRRSVTSRPKPHDLAVWLTLGEQQVDWDTLEPFDTDALRGALPALRDLTRDDPSRYLDRLTAILADRGVALTFVPEIPGLGIYGVTRWLRDHPVVQLSMRRKTDDQLWFTVFHELGHVLLHPHDGLYLTTDADEAERQANRFAADTLIPPDAVVRMPLSRNMAAVERFADEIGVAPGVVLGRVQHETGDYAWGDRLKRRFRYRTDAA
jgi:HTH-type transcriptional regulator/antitoxin HigA